MACKQLQIQDYFFFVESEDTHCNPVMGIDPSGESLILWFLAGKIIEFGIKVKDISISSWAESQFLSATEKVLIFVNAL